MRGGPILVARNSASEWRESSARGGGVPPARSSAAPAAPVEQIRARARGLFEHGRDPSSSRPATERASPRIVTNREPQAGPGESGEMAGAGGCLGRSLFREGRSRRALAVRQASSLDDGRQHRRRAVRAHAAFVRRGSEEREARASDHRCDAAAARAAAGVRLHGVHRVRQVARLAAREVEQGRAPGRCHPTFHVRIDGHTRARGKTRAKAVWERSATSPWTSHRPWPWPCPCPCRRASRRPPSRPGTP